jgi:hypothetical protein
MISRGNSRPENNALACALSISIAPVVPADATTHRKKVAMTCRKDEFSQRIMLRGCKHSSLAGLRTEESLPSIVLTVAHGFCGVVPPPDSSSPDPWPESTMIRACFHMLGDNGVPGNAQIVENMSDKSDNAND